MELQAKALVKNGAEMCETWAAVASYTMDASLGSNQAPFIAKLKAPC